MTEDNGDPGDGFYRFLPNRPGQLARGGRLQMLAITGDKEYDTATGQRVGEVLDVHWVDIANPDRATPRTTRVRSTPRVEPRVGPGSTAWRARCGPTAA
jgi:hypothetical protein